jgi:hypothetical protein
MSDLIRKYRTGGIKWKIQVRYLLIYIHLYLK